MDKKIKTFTITEDHLKLLSRLRVGWNYSGNGIPLFDVEKPYGNKDIYRDMFNILGWNIDVVLNDEKFNYFSQDDRLPKAIEDKLYDIHKETEKALEICMRTRSFEPGTYQTDVNESNWKRINEDT